ncbi:MAG: exopolyphosphatase [Deltaproteobacteria bacterium]|jgi:nanoRNase/pAp phosphatase (c-di-AMP/oligoRNAs hydrolase)|nr:exopolyphosphatase [Deltaproteobacteria bacterium]
MRLVTRSDFDGLACAVLLRSIGLIEEYKFAHPKDLQDGLVEVTDNDVLANVPYVRGCGMWFDHHSSERERLGDIQFEGASKAAPSCARVIWDYYGGLERFPARLVAMMEAVDKVDSAQLTRDNVLNPGGWVLLGMIMDPRTGLGRYHDYRISNHQLMLDMIGYCSEKSAEEILRIEDVKERTDRYFAQQKDFMDMLSRCSRQEDNVLLIDLRNEPEIFSGNRFTAYAMYPETNVSVQVIWGLKQQNVVITVGHSILKHGCAADVGRLMLSHGGGGHFQVGTCQVPTAKAEQSIKGIVQALKGK